MANTTSKLQVKATKKVSVVKMGTCASKPEKIAFNN